MSRKFRRGCMGVAVAAMTMAASVLPIQPASAGDWVIATKRVPKDPAHCDDPGPATVLSRLGPADVELTRTADLTFGAYKAAVGDPASRHLEHPYQLLARWRGRHAAALHFMTLGVPTAPRNLVLTDGTLSGRGWVTQNGARVGQTRAEVKSRYGRQMWRVPALGRGVWRIAGHCGYPVSGGDQYVLSVKIRAGKVASFGIFVGAAGE